MSSQPALYIKLLTSDAKLPTKGSSGAAGYDLYAAKNMVIGPRERGLVPIDISVGIPEGCYGRVAPRSGLALRSGIDVGAGVIDYDYRGAVGVVIFNHGHENFEINIGDKIAQLILEKIESNAPVIEVSELSDTERGSGGFGSTGR